MDTEPQVNIRRNEPEDSPVPQEPSGVVADAAAALAFLQMLFGTRQTGFLAITGFPGPQTSFFDLSQPAALERAAEHAITLAASGDVYFGVGVQGARPAEGRGKAEGVSSVPGLWLDLDVYHPTAHAEKNLPPDEATALDVLSEFGKPATITVHTGHGLQLYWLLEKSWQRDGDEWLERARGEVARLQAIVRAISRKRGFRLDNTADLARLLRLGGTVNWKVRDEAKPVTWTETGPRYALPELIQHVDRKHKELVLGVDAGGGWRGVFGGTDSAAEGQNASGSFDGFEGFVRQHTSEKQGGGFPPAEWEPILAGCRWLQYCCEGAKDLSEPDWYAQVGIVVRCRDGRALAHRLSAPYHDYEWGQTEKKLEHALSAAGPATCEHVINALGHGDMCAACANLGRVKSPINLGIILWSKPLPLSAVLPSVKQFDSRLLPDALRPWIEDIAERLQTPLDFPAATMLIALATATGRRATITPLRNDRTWRVVPNLWGGLVGRSATMKSPVIRTVLGPLRNMADLAMAEYATAFEQYERDLEARDVRKSVWRKDAAKNGAQTGFEEPKPEKPPCTRFIVNDATVEKLHEILKENPQGVLLNRDELAGWFATLDTRGRERDRPFFLEAWNGDGDHTFDRVGRGTVHVSHLCLSVFGGVQPAKLQAYLVGAVTGGPTDDGLAQRLQVLVWPDQPSDWHQIDRAHDAAAEAVAMRVFENIVKIPPEIPVQARFSPEAQDLFDEWRRELERRLRREKMPEVLNSHLAKHRSLMPSIALLLHLADGGLPENGEQSTLVPLIQAQRAAAWCEYLESHARRAYSCVASVPQRLAAQLGEHLKAGDLGTEFTARDVYIKGWANLDTAEAAQTALRVLEDAGWVWRKKGVSGLNGGRPTDVFLVNPEVYHG